MADLLDSNGDVKSGALDNVPPSNDASALTTGTLSADRLGAGSIGAAKLAETYLKPDGDGSGLTGLSSSSSSVTLPLDTGASVTAGAAVSLASNGNVANYPVLNTISNEINTDSVSYSAFDDNGLTRARIVYTEENSYRNRLTIYGQYINPTTGVVTEHPTSISYTNSVSNGSQLWSSGGSIASIGDNLYIAYLYTANNDNSYRRRRSMLYIVSVDPNTGQPAFHGSRTLDNTHNASFNYFNLTISRQGYIRHWHRDTDQNKYGGWAYVDKSTKTFVGKRGINDTYDGSVFNAIENSSKTTYLSSSGGYVCRISGNTLYRAAISNNEPVAQNVLSSSLASDYQSNGVGLVIDNTRILHAYKNASGNYILSSYNVASDGTATLVDSLDSGTLQICSNSTSFSVNNTNEFIIQGTGGYRTVELDASNNILGLGAPITYYGINSNIIQFGSDKFLVEGTGLSGKFYRIFTVNAYSTDAFDYFGVANTNTSSGNVEVTIAGVKDGYTGLTPGKTYYLSDAFDGSINTDSTKGTPKIGKAISSTQILLAEIS